jgi:hypothetical protein
MFKTLLVILKIPVGIVIMIMLIIFLFGGQIITITLKTLVSGIKALLKAIFNK